METNTDHLAALYTRRSHERARLDASRTDAERKIRAVWVAGIDREIASEDARLGMAAPEPMTDDELMAALTA